MDVKIAKAMKMTDEVCEQMEKAREQLSVAWVNGYGVFTDPSGIKSSLRAARDAINAAIEKMSACDWPVGEDYRD